MREVSCRVLGVLEHAASVNGLRYDDLVQGLPVPSEGSRDLRGWIDWDVLAEILERYQRVTGPTGCVELGRAAVHFEIAGPLRRVAGLWVDLRYLYRAGVHWLLPLFYRNVRIQLRSTSRRTLQIETTIPPYFRGSQSWFRVLHGGLEALPAMLKLPHARVVSEITDHRAVYSIELPQQTFRPLARMRSWLHDPALTELERQIEALRMIDEERFALESTLHERERRYANLIANLSGMVYRCRADLTFEFASGRCLELTGYGAEELIGEPLSSLVFAQDAAMLYEKRKASLMAGQPASDEYRLCTRSGEVRRVLDVARGVYDSEGRPLGIEGFITDVSAHKRLEEELNQARRAESLGRLAGGIAHEFNDLLTVILGSSELARCSLPADSPARPHTEQVSAAAERAAMLTQQLLSFARKRTPETRVVNLNALVRGTSELLSRTLAEKVELECELAGDLWSVEIDPGQFERALLELTINARDAMPRGGKLKIETANIVLEESTWTLPGLEPGLYVLLSLSDTGVGMSEEVQARAFDPFFTTKEVGQGMGLGLATVHGTVQQAHGQIFLHSALGRGTSARIYLPPVPCARDEVTSGLSPTGDGKVVLVVDDHEMLRGIVVRALQAQGYAVLAAPSGPEALELAARSELSLDLLLTDVVMPQMSGLELAARLFVRYPGLPVLYMSGFSEHHAVRAHPTASVMGFLPKPFTPAALVRKVGEVLERARGEARGAAREHSEESNRSETWTTAPS